MKETIDPVPDRDKPMYYLYLPGEFRHNSPHFIDMMCTINHNHGIFASTVYILRSLLVSGQMTYEEAILALDRKPYVLFPGTYSIKVGDTVARRNGGQLFEDESCYKGICVSLSPFVVLSADGRQREWSIGQNEKGDFISTDPWMGSFFTVKHHPCKNKTTALKAYKECEID